MSIAEKIIRAKTDLDEVYEAGKKSEYDRFWDAIQTNGERTSYNYTFYGAGFDDTNFEPKYDFRLTSGLYMFSTSAIVDIVGILKKQNIILDTSKATSVQAMFQGCKKLKKAPKIDLSSVGAVSANMLFNSCTSLEEVEEVVFHSGITSTASMFAWCSELKHLKISGEIACSVDVGYSPLDAESLVSVVEHFSTTATGLTLTVKQSAVNNADWSKTNYASWDELKAIRPNLGFAYR